jgi:hypothetical protein
MKGQAAQGHRAGRALLLGLSLAWACCLPAASAADKAAGALAAQPSSSPRIPPRTMKIRLKINGKLLFATLYDNPSARDFAAQLPLTLTLDDYAATEKIAYLPRKLRVTGAPAGFTPAAGDITYYAPWGNLAIFHRDFSHSSGLISLGRIDSGAATLKTPGKLKLTLERIDE